MEKNLIFHAHRHGKTQLMEDAMKNVEIEGYNEILRRKGYTAETIENTTPTKLRT